MCLAWSQWDLTMAFEFNSSILLCEVFLFIWTAVLYWWAVCVWVSSSQVSTHLPFLGHAREQIPWVPVLDILVMDGFESSCPISRWQHSFAKSFIEKLLSCTQRIQGKVLSAPSVTSSQVKKLHDNRDNIKIKRRKAVLEEVDIQRNTSPRLFF